MIDGGGGAGMCALSMRRLGRATTHECLIDGDVCIDETCVFMFFFVVWGSGFSLLFLGGGGGEMWAVMRRVHLWVGARCVH